MITPDDRLAAFAAQLSPADLPATIRRRVKDLLLDAIASALAGRATEDRGAVEAMAARLAGAGSSTVLGGGTQSLAGATLVNGYQVTAATVCDVHRPTLCHIGPEVVPPALAIAEKHDLDGAALLAALAVGFEVAVRVALALDPPRSRARGWHLPGVAGPFGGAAAAGRLLGFDGLRMRHAFGHAGSQAAGTFAALGSAGVKLHQARGALSGLLAASFADAGLAGSAAPLLAADGGLLATYADGGRPDELTAGLGEAWRLEEISLRRWPAASGLQAVIAGVLELVERHAARPDDVATMSVALPARAFEMHADRGWDDQLAALQSARYVAAVALFDRRVWLEQFVPGRRGDERLAAFASQRVRVRWDTQLATGSAVVEIERGDGSRAAVEVGLAPGDPAAPLSGDELRAKLDDATATASLPGERIAQVARQVEALETLRSCRPLLALLRAEDGQTKEERR